MWAPLDVPFAVATRRFVALKPVCWIHRFDGHREEESTMVVHQENAETKEDQEETANPKRAPIPVE